MCIIRYSTLIFILLIAAFQLCIPVRLSAQQILEKKVNLSVKNESLKRVIKQLGQQIPVNFVYSSKAGLKSINITIKARERHLRDVLDEILPDFLTYEVLGNSIVIKNAKKDSVSGFPDRRANTSATFNGIIEGNLRSTKGIALPDVTVKIEGKITQIQKTDNNGKYRFSNLPAGNYKLSLSYLGLVRVTKQVILTDKQHEDKRIIIMQRQLVDLNEVLVVGYGSQKKASLVGAISSINIQELKNAAPSNLTNGIGGRITGIITRMGDGAIGGTQNRFTNGTLDDAQYFIRGKATTNGQAPLVLIDGVEGSFSRINPEDIASFSVLKDASATAVYGVRGANGVIIITTRGGTVGTPRIYVNTQMRILKPLAYPSFLGSYDYATLYNEALKNAGQSPFYTQADLEHYRLGDSPYTHPDVNWHDILMKDYTIEQQHIGNISGGTDKIRYYLSGEYNQAGGLFVTSNENKYNYSRYNLRTNIDFRVSKSTEVSLKVDGQLNDLNFALKSEQSGQRVNAAGWGDIATRRPLDGQLINPDGTYSPGTGVSGWNSLSDLYDGGFARRLQNNLQSNFSLNQKLDFITSGLSFSGRYAMSFTTGSTKHVIREGELWAYNPLSQTYTLKRSKSIPYVRIIAGSENFQGFKRLRQMEMSLNYKKTIAEDHKVTAMGIFIQSVSENHISLPRNFRGISGRVTYSYKHRYLAEGNVGYNGSDQFSRKNRYAVFPAVALGWAISEENIFKRNVKFIDFLKIRGSYGEVGNDQIAGFKYLYQYEFINSPVPGTSSTSNSYYSLGLSPVNQIGLAEGTLSNDNVSWEIARKGNVGIDCRLFKNHLTFTGDIFKERRSNILTKRSDIPLYAGLMPQKLPVSNIGKVTNRGYEMELRYKGKLGEVGLTVGGSYTFVRNTIDYIAESPKKYSYQFQAGHPIGQRFGYVWTGKFYDFPDLTNPDVPKPVGKVYPGDLIFKDINNDGVINTNDRTAIGYAELPEEMFGFNIDLDYKNFYMNTFWQGASNTSIMPGGPIRYEFAPNVQQFHKNDRWIYDPSRGLDTRTTATYPSLIIGGSAQTRQVSSFNLLNAEYLRLRSVEFGYNFGDAITKKLRVAALRIYLSGSNLLTFDHLGKYGIDPEYSGSANGAYSPQSMFYAFGLSVTF